jgi:hypothetical protein
MIKAASDLLKSFPACALHLFLSEATASLDNRGRV